MQELDNMELENDGMDFSDEDTQEVETETPNKSETLDKKKGDSYWQSRADKAEAERKKMEQKMALYEQKLMELENKVKTPVEEDKVPVPPKPIKDMYDTEEVVRFNEEMTKYNIEMMNYKQRQMDKQLQSINAYQEKVAQEEKARQAQKAILEEIKSVGADEVEANGVYNFMMNDIVNYGAVDWLKTYRLLQNQTKETKPKLPETKPGLAELGGSEPRETNTGKLKRDPNWATKFRT